MIEFYLLFPELYNFLILLIVGFIVGRIFSHLHWKSIAERQEKFANINLFALAIIPKSLELSDAPLVTGSVVLSHDYYLGFLASIRGIFGGEIASYQNLLRRARIEAILRMKQSAANKNATDIYNVRFHSSRISHGGVVTVEMLCYGTAVKKI